MDSTDRASTFRKDLVIARYQPPPKGYRGLPAPSYQKEKKRKDVLNVDVFER
jgi:hypothetical protein